MQVRMDRSERTEGIFKKKTVHLLKATITLSEEESEACKRAGVTDRVLVKAVMEWDPEIDDTKHVRDIIPKRGGAAELILSASDTVTLSKYEKELKESLQALKQVINEQIQYGGETSETFEL